jgi:hypothetical protein
MTAGVEAISDSADLSAILCVQLDVRKDDTGEFGIASGSPIRYNLREDVGSALIVHSIRVPKLA